jgi:hypothetical protein
MMIGFLIFVISALPSTVEEKAETVVVLIIEIASMHPAIH